jgi:Na+/H+ antiporter NhaD/arsenite permease-like protein
VTLVATVVIFVGVYLVIATERLPRVYAALAGAAAVLALGVV